MPPRAAPQLPAPPPSALDLLRAEAASYGLVVDVDAAGVVVHWPDEDPASFTRVTAAEAREWIAEDASAAYAERLRTAAQRAGAPATAFARALLAAHDGMAATLAGLMLSQQFTQLHKEIGGYGTAAEHSAFCAAMVAAARAWARTYREEGS